MPRDAPTVRSRWVLAALLAGRKQVEEVRGRVLPPPLGGDVGSARGGATAAVGVDVPWTTKLKDFCTNIVRL